VVAPGDGTVVYARNDVPDQPTPGTVDRSYLNLPDPLHAVAGNNVLIDHGNGEFSSLGHLQHGSVRAKVGDTVTRGQVIGKWDHPHLHYQLMSGTDLTRSDGLPSQFVNVWLEDTVRGSLSRSRFRNVAFSWSHVDRALNSQDAAALGPSSGSVGIASASPPVTTCSPRVKTPRCNQCND
jgi:murein DD-endopeptidase MepM/ murein hydrolase activator NlpD